MVQQENAALRQRIEELESASVRAPGSHTSILASTSVSALVPGSHTSTPASPANIRPWINQQNTLFLICVIQSLVSHNWVILLRRGAVGALSVQ